MVLKSANETKGISNRDLAKLNGQKFEHSKTLMTSTKQGVPLAVER
jgi:chromatin remodeling complex protein RSC6